MHSSYKLAVIYFVFFSILLLVSAFMLFATKIGFSPLAISHYYLGNEEQFMQAKTLSGLLKVNAPHIFGIALFAMVLLHFIYFTSFKESKFFKIFIILTYIVVFLEVSSSFFLLLGFPMFSLLKLLSMFLMFVLFFTMLWLLLHSILIQKN